MSGRSLDDEIRESLPQLLELAERQREAGRLSEAECTYGEVILAAEQAHLPDMAERGQRGLNQLLSAQRLAQADAALRDHHLADAEALYREVCETLAPGDAVAASGLAQTNFLLGQQAEADERPMAAREYYVEALQLDPQLVHAQARLTAMLAPQHKSPSVKILWVLIPIMLALVIGTPLWLRSPAGVTRTNPLTPTVPLVAQHVLAPTLAPEVNPSVTPTEIVPPTVTAAPTVRSSATPTEISSPTTTSTPPMVPSPIPSATPVSPLTTDLTRLLH